MGIRDTTYYGWQNFYIDPQPSSESEYRSSFYFTSVAIDKNGTVFAAGGSTYKSGSVTRSAHSVYKCDLSSNSFDLIFEKTNSIFTKIIFDNNGNMFVVGADKISANAYDWVVYRSSNSLSGSFVLVDAVNRDSLYDLAYSAAVDSSNNIYVVGRERLAGNKSNGIVRKSTTGLSGSFSYVDCTSSAGTGFVSDIKIDSSNNIYTIGAYGAVRKSTTGLSGSFSSIDGFGNVSTGGSISISSGDDIYISLSELNGTTSKYDWIIRKSTTGLSGSFSDIYRIGEASADFGTPFVSAKLNDNSVYSGGYHYSETDIYTWIVKRSDSGLSGSFVDIMRYSSPIETYPEGIVINDNDIYIYGYFGNSKAGIIKKGRRTANSASLGPIMLNSYFGYVSSELTSSEFNDTKFKLNNISEFPHAGGVFQMKNVVIGTQDVGTIGKDDSNIIQVNHIGSVVKVMWPSQADQDTLIKGYGDFSVGERCGKLSTNFVPGDSFDVATDGYDHMSLYCYLLKNESGSLDNVELKVERKPLNGKAFASEQAVEYSTSGSFTVANLTDLVYKKEVNYGDLSMKEISWPIDVPIANTREVRISARQTVGQSLDGNRNFLVFARFIKSKEEV